MLLCNKTGNGMRKNLVNVKYHCRSFSILSRSRLNRRGLTVSTGGLFTA